MTELPKVTQLAGPGVNGLETDPPLYLFDLEPAQLFEMAADPVGFLKRLGLTREQGIGPQGHISVCMPNPTLQWSHQKDQWVQVDGLQAEADLRAGAVKWCTYVVGDKTIVHAHELKVEERK